MSKPQIHTHHLFKSTESNDPTLAKILNQLRKSEIFRTALPLYRRLQFGRFFEKSLLLTSLPLHDTEKVTFTPANGNGPSSETETGSRSANEEPWLAAFVDRSCRPETEVWMFGSWEPQSKAPTPSTATETHDTTDPELDPKVTALLNALLHCIKATPLPPSIHATDPTSEPSANNENNDVDAVGLSRSSYSSHASNPSITLWGAIHARTFPYLKALGVMAEGFDSTWVPNHMFIFSVASLPENKPLPASVRWGRLERKHFALVKKRTQIPRQDRTMALLPNLALFPTTGTEEERTSPVAWAFVGLDSSLTTLHVEPAYRRLGLAKTLTTKLLQEEMKLFWADGMERLAQGYVIVGNEASAGMCRALGGRADWEVYWLRVDIRQV